MHALTHANKQFNLVPRWRGQTNSGALVFLFIFFLWLFLLCIFLFNMVTYNVAKWATLSIAISSLQIVALFGQFPLVWPGFVRTMFEVISFANFNVEYARVLALPVFVRVCLGVVGGGGNGGGVGGMRGGNANVCSCVAGFTPLPFSLFPPFSSIPFASFI